MGRNSSEVREETETADNPLPLVGGAFALGLLTGLVLPVTQLERRNFGPIRDKLIGRAQDVAGEAVEHGKAVVRETTRAAMQTAMSSARDHGEDVLEAAQQRTGRNAS
jgi:hypothetical protein